MVSLSHFLARSVSILDEGSSDCKVELVNNRFAGDGGHIRARFCFGFILRVNYEVDIVLNA